MSIQGQQLNVCYTQQALHDCVSLLEESSEVCWCARIYHVDVFKERRASNGIDMRICIIHRCSNILAFLLRTTQLGPIFDEAEGARAKKIAGSAFFLRRHKISRLGTGTWYQYLNLIGQRCPNLIG